MSDEPFLLVSLEENKAKTLAQVLSNDTARKILDFLSKKEHATETEVSKEMNLPLSTVHYNLDLLVKSDLVSNEQFTYSEKGKQIVHYRLSNRYVIIAPKRTQALIDKLKQFLPVIGVVGLVSLGLKLYSQRPIPEAAPLLMAKSLEVSADAAMAGSGVSQSIFQSPEFSMWFLFGSVFTLLIYFVWAEIILKKIKKK
jgi:DNA-binding transcriptional ArsR family regulator